VTSNRCRLACVPLLILSTCLSGCGTVKEKTAPCKRPADLLGYGPGTLPSCGPALPVNGDRQAALNAIDTLGAQ